MCPAVAGAVSERVIGREQDVGGGARRPHPGLVHRPNYRDLTLLPSPNARGKLAQGQQHPKKMSDPNIRAPWTETRSNRLFHFLDSYWHSPKSGDLSRESRQLKKTI